MRATQARVHLGSFKENLSRIRQHVGASVKMCVAVKADAYGHGIVPVARVARAEGVEYLATATVDEALALRDAGDTGPVILYSLPGRHELDELIARRITPVIADLELATHIAEAVRRRARDEVFPVHLKVDTGMGRIGCRPEHALAIARFISESHHISMDGMSTHFPVSDGDDPDYTREQIARFTAVLDQIRSAGLSTGLVHSANSGAVLDQPHAYFDMIRPGILTYGYYPSTLQKRSVEVHPVMELVSELSFVKDVFEGESVSYGRTWIASRHTRVGTVTIGYGDGYMRALSNKAEVFVGGRRCPIVGTICMDQLMVDLGPESADRVGDEVILFGPGTGLSGQDGDTSEDISSRPPDAIELAALAGTIPYEILTNVNKRVPRVYLED